MSYDVSLSLKVEDVPELVNLKDTWLNITFNVSEMIEAACNLNINSWNGNRASDVLPNLREGYSELVYHADKYKQYESPNGWGTVPDTANFLKSMITNCEEYPFAYIIVEK